MAWRVWFLSLLSLMTAAKQAAAAELVVLPWHTIAVLPEERRLSAKDLDRARQNWIEQLLNAKRNLNQAQDPARPIIANLGAFAKLTQIGNAKDPRLEKPDGKAQFAITPSLCTLADSHLVMVSMVGLNGNNEGLLLAGSHQLISKKDWLRARKAKTLGPRVQEALYKAWEQTLGQYAARPTRAPSALTVGLSLSQESSRQDHGSNFCIQQLLAEKLASQAYRVRAVMGLENIGSLAHVRGEPEKHSRATRELIFTWLYDLKAHPAARQKFPLSLQLAWTATEAVFASSLPVKPPLSTWTLQSNANAQIDFAIAPELLALLKTEESSLMLADLPRIVKIRRAWVYLDKGRAYGLKMNDRLVVKGREGDIQGHVVAFYGPEVSLPAAGPNAPKPPPVHEGAIVYIRKGQNETKLGQELRFDRETFPSAWPPAPSQH